MTKNKKQVLYELVKENTTSEYIIIGALSKAGLLKQYEEEKEKYGSEPVEPTITEKELEKIIKDFRG